jgi:DNA processing protein
VTEQITAGLVSGGFVIVSGLAYGVDAVAHRTTIIAGGKTVAVLGCGIDCCSPREHTGLYAEIITSGGAVVSEYPLGMAPTRGSFPSRNRIIAGLSQAVILTEGAADSGALYTANEAFANDRPVFAVPGPVTSSLSAAPFALINRGGTLITGADDVLRSLGEKHLISKTREKRIGETPQEQKIIDALQYEQLHFDEIVKKVNLDTIEVGRLLSLMELKGFIKSEGGFYVLI